MHEMYARDISKKVGSTFRMKQEKGIFYRTATIPYGYRMNESGTNYRICEQTAPIVPMIICSCSGTSLTFFPAKKLCSDLCLMTLPI